MMSARAEIASAARGAAADAAWRQWAALGAPVSAAGTTAVIDPEALLLLSCTLRVRERRLDDVLGWWAGAGAALLSVQRVRTIARRYPARVCDGLAAFAHAAMDAGDGGWRSVTRADAGDPIVSRGKRGREPRIATAPALMLRLRAAFGVGVKADVLAVLIAMGGADATVRALVHATGYTAAAIRRAVREMSAARVVRSTSTRPASYRVDPASWSAFLGMEGEPGTSWRYFADLFAFLAAVMDWGEAGDDNGYVAATTARDIFEAHRTTFELNRIPFIEPDDAPGARYLDAFGTTVDHLGAWLLTSL
ncbi:MAG TPA: hypothetical protein VFJ16_16465 [Longimicrobium sp.]|nr:hypothetical protein [Longimicrobium sp.]